MKTLLLMIAEFFASMLLMALLFWPITLAILLACAFCEWF